MLFCLFIHLFNYIYEHLLCAMYCASILHALSHFGGSSMPSLPLVPELHVAIPYFLDTFSRTMKMTAPMNCLDTMIKRLNIVKHRDM